MINLKRKRKRKKTVTHNISFFINSCLYITVLISCSEESKKVVKDFDDIVPKSHSTPNSTSQDVQLGMDTQKLNYYSNLTNFKIDSIIDFEQNLIPDRFNPISKHKEIIYSNSDSTLFLYWRYKDTVDSKRAFFNLLDCFEEPCKSIKLFEKKTVSKSSFIIFEEMNSLVVLKSNNPINLDSWIQFLVEKEIFNNFDFIISQKGRNMVQWLSFKDGKIKEIRK